MFSFLRTVIVLALLGASLPICSAHAQVDQQRRRVHQTLSARRFLVTYRTGGPVYGTYYFLDVHFGASGRYVLSGQSRKQTVLGNEQVNSWTDAGTWTAGRFQGWTGVYYASASGRRELVPVHVHPNGRIQGDPGVSILHRGWAQCP